MDPAARPEPEPPRKPDASGSGSGRVPAAEGAATPKSGSGRLPAAEGAAPPKGPGSMSVGDALKRLSPLDVLIALLFVTLAATFATPSPGAQRVENEAAAVNTMRQIQSMEKRYQQKMAEQGLSRFASSFLELAAADVFEGPVPDGAFLTRGGYIFKIGTLDPDHYFAIARPERFGGTGDRSYYTDETGVLRAAAGPVVGPAFPEAH